MNPVGITETHPRFTWIATSDKRNAQQAFYQIQLFKDKALVWDTKQVSSGQSVLVEYAGPALLSDTHYQWRVKIGDNEKTTSDWSAWANFHTGFFNTGDWVAKWITTNEEIKSNQPCPIFRKEFLTKKKIKTAYAYITAHGMYEANLNGAKMGDALLTPGWTSYKTRLQYQCYDVTAMLKKGVNAIGVTIGNGWYKSTIGFSNHSDFYGKDISLFFQLNILYEDGTKEVITSDDSWKYSSGAIQYAEIYNGETIDARKEQTGWTVAGFNDKSWAGVKVEDFSLQNLISAQSEPVTQRELIQPIKIFTTPKGERVIDFGQNLVGWAVIKVKGKPGDKITLSHAEVLDKQGNFYTDNLRAAKAQDTYILKGEGEEAFHPHFTWHGFRYLRIEGYPGEILPENFKAMVLHSSMAPTGTFSSSNTLINQLQHNIQWGQKGNFLDVPTDCPQRDERLGWTGDAQVFSRTASFNMNVHNFFTKWLKDIEADQVEGRVPFVVPNILGDGSVNSAGWSDVATIIPWNMYLAYGDKKILENQYNSMKAYVESIRKVAKDDLWNSGFHFGDWLFYRPEDDNDGRSAVTDKYLIAQCFYAQSTQILINTANVLNKTEDVQFYTALLNNIKKAFQKEYVTPGGRLVSSTQTAYVLALHFDMLPEEVRAPAAKRLAENVVAYNNHLTTGFLGTPYLCHVLTRFGYTDVAYKLLLQEKYPSWLYPVKMGATTIWERWDGQKPDSSFQSVGMNSFNHYAYGAIGDWMYRVMAGLDTDEDGVGYKHIKIKPHIGGNIKEANATLQTYYGKVVSGWKIDNDIVRMSVDIPFNTTATICIPANAVDAITENGKKPGAVTGITVKGIKDGYVELQAGSGNYEFEVRK